MFLALRVLIHSTALIGSCDHESSGNAARLPSKVKMVIPRGKLQPEPVSILEAGEYKRRSVEETSYGNGIFTDRLVLMGFSAFLVKLQQSEGNVVWSSTVVGPFRSRL